MVIVVAKTAVGCSEAIELDLGFVQLKACLVLVAVFHEGSCSLWIVRLWKLIN